MKSITFDCLSNDLVPGFKALSLTRHGVSVKSMPAKVNGCFQTKYSRVKITFNEGVVGHSCNYDQFNTAKDAVLRLVESCEKQGFTYEVERGSSLFRMH